MPAEESVGYDIRDVIEALFDEGSFFEIKPLFAAELVTGFALLEGQVVGIVANQPAVKGGVLFVDSADKAARFIWLCDAFNVPLVYLADVPGFMIGSEVERQGIIRHGAKMITAVAEATVPTVSVIVRKAYGAGLYAMCGPGFGPDACLALPTAKIAVMGPEAAVNAVYFNKIAAIDDEAERAAYVAGLREEYEADIDILRLASDLVIDAIVEPEPLRDELVARLAAAATKTVRSPTGGTASRRSELRSPVQHRVFNGGAAGPACGARSEQSIMGGVTTGRSRTRPGRPAAGATAEATVRRRCAGRRRSCRRTRRRGRRW